MNKTPLLPVCAAVLAFGFVACDAAPSRDAGSASPTPETIAAGESLVDVVRDRLVDILRDPDAYSKARRLGTLLPTLGPETLPAVRQILADRSIDWRASELELLLRYWATFEPAEAALWAKKMSPPGYREPAVYTAIQTWASADPKTAADATWSWSVDIKGLERIVPIAIVRGWYASDQRDELEAWIANVPPGIMRQRAIAAYILMLIQAEGSEAVMRWAESVPEQPAGYKIAVFRRTVDALSTLEPEAGMRWCDAHCDGPHGTNMRSIIGRNWVLHDGPAALAWIQAEDPGVERDLAVHLTWALWSRNDLEAAMGWMAEQEELGPVDWLEPAIPVYARLLSGEQPEKAIEWAKRIANERRRENIVIGVARVWRYLDEAAAEAWLRDSELSDVAKERVRKPVEGDGPPMNF